ncbi:MAG: ABC transporter ATP-binding protein [Gaiellaceae bacterium]
MKGGPYGTLAVDFPRRRRLYAVWRTTRIALNAATSSLLAARSVGRRFGARVALVDIDFDAAAGDSVALVGANGAGKSTLLALLAGALEPTSGEIVRDAVARRVGWVPQRPALYSRLSARENLEHFARLEAVSSPKERAGELLELVEVTSDPIPAGTLSGGNQQRLNLAIALLGDPDALLLDEPTSSLDPRQRRRFWQIARTLPERGGALVYATQHLSEVDENASHVMLLEGGRCVFTGTLAAWHASEAIEALR